MVSYGGETQKREELKSVAFWIKLLWKIFGAKREEIMGGRRKIRNKLTPGNRVLLEEVITVQLIKKFPAFYGI
jgi:hypothetical protein